MIFGMYEVQKVEIENRLGGYKKIGVFVQILMKIGDQKAVGYSFLMHRFSSKFDKNSHYL